MARILTDREIDELLHEHKSLPTNWQSRLQPRPKSNFSYSQRDYEIQGENGHVFRIVIRKNEINPLDFSIILTFRDNNGAEFNLCRYNGRHPSQHTNKLEKAEGLSNSKFRNAFHIHKATQRYQEMDLAIDGYAEATDDYSSFDTALHVFVRSNGFSVDTDEGPTLFNGQGDSR